MNIRLDFPFTARDAPEDRKRVERDLWHVATRVARSDPHLDALVLTGGFSRGEGTVHDGEPVNDYDLVAFRRRPGGARAYRALGHALTRELGIEVDLLPVWRARVPRLAPKLFWLDLRLGGRVLIGGARALARVPEYSARDLPLSEVARLLGNRAAGLLLALPAHGEPADPAMRDLQATKAALAAMDASLIARGAYGPRLRDRLDMTRDHLDHDLFKRAVEWKLDATPRSMGDAWWDETRDALLRAVASTGARGCDGSVLESAYHAAAARRLRRAPSQAIREEAWTRLAACEDGVAPVDWTRAAKDDFFARRARTLQ